MARAALRNRPKRQRHRAEMAISREIPPKFGHNPD
jgi:hypothetical protein